MLAQERRNVHLSRTWRNRPKRGRMTARHGSLTTGSQYHPLDNGREEMIWTAEPSPLAARKRSPGVRYNLVLPSVPDSEPKWQIAV